MRRLAYILRQVPGSAYRIAVSQVFRTLESSFHRSDSEVKAMERPIILAAVERSGGTWLSNLIANSQGTQQIFEPFSEPAWTHGFCKSRVNPSSVFCRRYMRAATDHPAAADLALRVVRGELRSLWTDLQARCPRPKRYLIKAVSIHLSLGILARVTGARVVLLMRHPCAVVESRSRGFGGVFRDDYLDRIFSQSELNEDYLSPFISEAQLENDLLVRHGIEWAIEHAVALDSLKKVEHRVVFYEKLISDPQTELERLSDFLEIEIMAAERTIERPTHTSTRKYMSQSDRLASWQERLDHKRANAIIEWATHVGIDAYDGTLLPDEDRLHAS